MGKMITSLKALNTLKGIFEGDIGTGIEVIETGEEIAENISDELFLRNFRAVISGLDKNGTASRKVGKKLAESGYGEEYGFVLLKHIDSFESEQKGKFLANLMDSVSKDFICADECFIFAKMISDVSLITLSYMKNNLKHGVFLLENKLVLNELLRYNLLYEAVGKDKREGYAYSKEAYILDKYSLSYTDESRYKYNGEKDFVPKEFPDEVMTLSI